MLSIILRCCNRLQYTQMVLESLARQVHPPKFEVIIIDNNSGDGTREWVNWILKNESTRTYFPPLRYFHMNKNFGDWGGMVQGATKLTNETKYVGQLDNDITLAPIALSAAVGTLNAGLARVVMLKRLGVKRIIGDAKKASQHKVGEFTIKLTPLDWCVACWFTEAKHFKNASKYSNCRKFTGSIGSCKKILNVTATQIEGWQQDGVKSYLQKRKYEYDKWKHMVSKGFK